MEKIKWYQSTTLRALLVAFVSQLVVWLGIAEQLPEGSQTFIVDSILQIIALVATAYAAWARTRRANPPITEAAVRKVETINDSSKGFSVQSFLVLLSAIGMVGLAVPVIVNLQGCAAIGIQPAKSFTESLAYAYAQNTALREAAANSLDVGRITTEDAEYVLKLTDQSRALLDAARLAHTAGDVGTAEGRLQMVLNVLVQVQSYLNKKGAGL